MTSGDKISFRVLSKVRRKREGTRGKGNFQDESGRILAGFHLVFGLLFFLQAEKNGRKGEKKRKLKYGWSSLFTPFPNSISYLAAEEEEEGEGEKKKGGENHLTRRTASARLSILFFPSCACRLDLEKKKREGRKRKEVDR